MARLFDVNISAISKYLSKIYEAGELKEKSVSSIFPNAIFKAIPVKFKK